MSRNYYAPTTDEDTDDSYAWVVAFQDAVAEMDVETREAIRLLIRAIEIHFENSTAAPKTAGARHWQAVQIVARLVWNKRGINFDELIIASVKG